MPTNPSGVFTLPSSTWVETGDTVLPEQHNPPFADVEQGLTDRLMRDGRAPMTGPLAMGGFRITGIGAPSADGDAVTRAWANGQFALLTRTISAGTGLSGGGDLTANRTLAVLYGTTAETAVQGNDTRVVNAVQNSRTLTAGNGLTGGGDLSANRTFTLGTPSAITVSTRNTVSSTSHTHDLDLSGRSILAGNGMTGGGTLAADRTITMGTPGTITTSTSNGVSSTSHTHNLDLSGRTITAGEGLSGGGNLGANRTISLDISELPYLTEAPDRVVVSNTSGTSQYRCGTATLASALPANTIQSKLADATNAAVGDTFFCMWTGTGAVTAGITVSGSTLMPCAANTANNGNTLAGTWACKGYASSSSNDARATLWQRKA